MAQKLQQIILFRSQAFQQGYIDGVSGRSPKWCPLSYPLDEEDIVTIVRNLLEIQEEGWMSEDRLRNHVGLLAGWLVARKQ